MPEFISLQDHKIGLGESEQVYLNVAMLPTHTPIDLPVHVIRAKKDGPVVLLTGGLHGDEINGIEIIRRMIEKDRLSLIKGSVIAIPIVNIYGFILNVRGVPDGKDINRSFPGIKGGSLARLLAYTMMQEIIPNIDIGIDFHTGGAARANLPQIRCVLKDKQNTELAKVFGAPVILNSNLIDKSFRKAAAKKGKPVLVYETGESLRLDEEGIELGIDGTLRVLKHLGMAEYAPNGTSTRIFKKSTWVRARNAGLFQSRIELGDELNKRQVLGYITDPFGNESFKVVAPKTGMVIGINNNPVIHKGDAIIHFAYNSSEQK